MHVHGDDLPLVTRGIEYIAHDERRGVDVHEAFHFIASVRLGNGHLPQEFAILDLDGGDLAAGKTGEHHIAGHHGRGRAIQAERRLRALVQPQPLAVHDRQAGELAVHRLHHDHAGLDHRRCRHLARQDTDP